MKYFFGLLLAWWLSETYWGFIEIRLSSSASVGKNPPQSLCIYEDLKSEFHLCGKDCAQEAHLMGVGLNDQMQTILKYIGCTSYACIDIKLKSGSFQFI